MRFIGNKENLCERIFAELSKRGISGTTVFDAFAGTTSVGKFFKRKGFRVFSSDLLYFSFVLQKAYIETNDVPKFSNCDFFSKGHTSLFPSRMEQIIDFLNEIPGESGFVFKNYTPAGGRMYFSEENGCRIDAIRKKIEEWFSENKISETEYFVLLACLVESVSFYANVSGVYAAFQKKWDPRALKKFQLRPISLVPGTQKNAVFLGDAVETSNAISADIFYLDPPYNQRQYAPNYHLVETIARNDSPQIHGITGIREKYERSRFCNAKTALIDLGKIARNGNFSTLVMSYNNEGIMSQNSILEVLGNYGNVEMVEFEYPRFKSNSNIPTANKNIREQLYILRK